MQNRLLTSVFLFFCLLMNQLAFAQGNNPCNTSQPRPITGNQHPCPGSIETYCIRNDRGYTSFEWDVPRAQAGNPPTGWQIISGQGTSCVQVRVGTKSGTMKVKVNDLICGTKVATLPVKPGRGFVVDINGPDSVCANIQQIFTATVSDSLGRGNGNGKGQVKGTFNFNWTVPAGWVIVSGQGTNTIKVTPGATGGQVTVSTTYSSQGSGKGNNGNGVGGYKGYCNTNASDAIDVKMRTNCGSNPTCSISADITGPDTVCAYNDEPYVFTTPAQAGATYTWMVPVDWYIESGEGTNTITVYAGFEPGDVMVTVANECGTASDIQPVAVNEDCGLIEPLPVELISFDGKSSAEGIALTWSTASEKNNDKFEVQRSADGRSFETIGTVKGNGSTTTQQSYNFLDARPANGLNYFRLRQVDFDGTAEFSKVITVNATGRGEMALTLYPNPATNGEFNVKIAPTNEPVTLQVTDLSGKLLHTREVKNTSEVSLNGNALGMKPGIYLVSLKAGKMLDMGFMDDIMRIVANLPKERQTLLFSATMPPKIRELAKKILNEPEEISLAISKPAEKIDQRFYFTYDTQKLPLLESLINGLDVSSMIVFTSRKSNVNSIVRSLQKLGFTAEGIQSDIEQDEREKVLLGFRNRKFQILVATDIMSRGIDIDNISHVVNFDMPQDAEDYIHRIGRTARAAATGTALTFVNEKDMYKIPRIERLIEKEVPKFELPEFLGKGPEFNPNAKPEKRGGKEKRGSKRRSGGGKERSGARPQGESGERNAAISTDAAPQANNENVSKNENRERNNRNRKPQNRKPKPEVDNNRPIVAFVPKRESKSQQQENKPASSETTNSEN